MQRVAHVADEIPHHACSAPPSMTVRRGTGTLMPGSSLSLASGTLTVFVQQSVIAHLRSSSRSSRVRQPSTPIATRLRSAAWSISHHCGTCSLGWSRSMPGGSWSRGRWSMAPSCRWTSASGPRRQMARSTLPSQSRHVSVRWSGADTSSSARS